MLLAGLSIGFVLVTFNALLELNVFPKFKTMQAFSLLKQLIYLTFTVGIVGIIAWVSINLKGQASSAVTREVANSTTKAWVSDAEITVSERTETARTDDVGYFELPFWSPAPTGKIVPAAPIVRTYLPPPPQFTITAVRPCGLSVA